MKSNEEGNVILEMAILLCIVASLVLMYFVKKRADLPSRETIEISKSVESIFNHIDEIEAQQKSVAEDIEALESSIQDQKFDFNKRFEAAIDGLNRQIDDCQDHLARIRSNDQVFAENQKALNDKLKAVPRLIDRKLKLFNRPVSVTIEPQKTVGYERIVQKKGQRYKQMIFKTRPIHEDKPEKPKKFNMPGVKEAKGKIVEAGL
jgi:septal ring factor EnvC (AmiA/AmiB activator)